MEENREKDETFNQIAYQQAREISAYLSLYKFGNPEQCKKAAKVISAL
jgi:hypothetical protein